MVSITRTLCPVDLSEFRAMPFVTRCRWRNGMRRKLPLAGQRVSERNQRLRMKSHRSLLPRIPGMSGGVEVALLISRRVSKRQR